MRVKCQIVGCPDPEADRHTLDYVDGVEEVLESQGEALEVVCENEYVRHLRRPDGRGIIVKNDLKENPYLHGKAV